MITPPPIAANRQRASRRLLPPQTKPRKLPRRAPPASLLLFSLGVVTRTLRTKAEHQTALPLNHECSPSLFHLHHFGVCCHFSIRLLAPAYSQRPDSRSCPRGQTGYASW